MGHYRTNYGKEAVAISRMWLQCFIDYFRIMSEKEDIHVTAADELLVSLAISSYYSECAKMHFWFIAGGDLLLKCVPQVAPVTEYTKILFQPSPFSFKKPRDLCLTPSYHRNNCIADLLRPPTGI